MKNFKNLILTILPLTTCIVYAELREQLSCSDKIEFAATKETNCKDLQIASLFAEESNDLGPYSPSDDTSPKEENGITGPDEKTIQQALKNTPKEILPEKDENVEVNPNATPDNSNAPLPEEKNGTILSDEKTIQQALKTYPEELQSEEESDENAADSLDESSSEEENGTTVVPDEKTIQQALKTSPKELQPEEESEDADQEEIQPTSDDTASETDQTTAENTEDDTKKAYDDEEGVQEVIPAAPDEITPEEETTGAKEKIIQESTPDTPITIPSNENEETPQQSDNFNPDVGAFEESDNEEETEYAQSDSVYEEEIPNYVTPAPSNNAAPSKDAASPEVPCCQPPCCGYCDSPCCDTCCEECDCCDATCGDTPCCEKAICEQLKSPCCEEQNRGPFAFLYPKDLCLACPKNFYVYGELLIMQLQEDGLDFVIKNEGGIDFPLEHGSVKGIGTQDDAWSWKPGVRVGLGLYLGCERWNLDLSWTYLYTHENRKIHASDDESLVPLFGFPSTISGSTVDKAKESWECKINYIDLVFAKPFYLSRHFIINPLIGIRGASVDQEIHNKYTGGISSGFSSIDFILTPKVDSDFRGLGLTGGLNTEWILGKGWEIFGKIAGSLLYSKFDIKQNTPAFPASAIIIETETEFEEHRFTVVPTLEIMAGIQWGTSFGCNKYHIAVRLDYEFHYWWKQNNFSRFFDNIMEKVDKAGDLQFTGFGIGVQLDF